ncbi:Alpha 1,3 fucosyltransferase [Mortierella alpina]|nr:Alpha 1,3 fucosyltransferase [Mortierella alpina]
MPATPVQAERESRARILKSKKMPVQDYPVLWWTEPPSQPPRAHHTDTLDANNSPTVGPGAWLPFTLGDCGLPYTCTFSNDRETLSDSANVVLFTGSKLDRANMPSTHRNKTQAWVLNQVLGPRYSITPEDALPFTHSWSHTFGSDFVETVFASTMMEVVTAPPKISLQEKNRLRALGKDQGGKAPAAWIVLDNESNEEAVGTGSATGECFATTAAADAAAKDAPSGRESYVRELQKLMDIDIYGGCMGNTVWPVHEDTQKPWSAEEIMRQYKFVFVLERVNCEDYVTRSLADALMAGVVPIVDGPQDYSRFAPTSNAFIQLNKFISPELLAQELDAMDRDDALYQQRISYKNNNNNNNDDKMEPGSQRKAPLSSVDSVSPTLQTLSPLFLNTFRHRPSKDVLTTSGTTGIGSSVEHDQAEWEPNRHGAYCGICQLAHDLAEKEYDWKAHEDRAEKRKAVVSGSISESASASASSGGGVCESVPRYLPGLPTQMAAYDEYLQREQHLQPENHEGVEYDNPLTKLQSVKVTVDMAAPHEQPPFGKLISSSSSSSTSSSAAAIVYHGQEELGSDDGLLSLRAGSPHPALNAEVTFLLLLILVLSLGALAVAWATSKNARRLMSWPWRRLYYSKIPQEISLERIMLDELGEDLLYD